MRWYSRAITACRLVAPDFIFCRSRLVIFLVRYVSALKVLAALNRSDFENEMLHRSCHCPDAYSPDRCPRRSKACNRVSRISKKDPRIAGAKSDAIGSLAAGSEGDLNRR